MALRYSTRKTVRADPSTCEQCLLRADKFLGKSKYVERIEQVSEGVYHVRFKWRKWGMTRRYDVVFRVRKEGDRIVYESVEGSKYPMRLSFRLRGRNSESVLEADAEMEAGLMADLLGKKDFAEFIDELVETGFVSLIQEMAGGQTPGTASGARCDRCLLYDPDRKYCYYLRQNVENPQRPPCGGKGFIPEEAG